MISKLAWTGLAALACGSALRQTAQAPAIGAPAAKFEITNVYATPKALANTFMEVNPPSNGRYEFHSASMIDLIGLAYGVDDDKILGGPSWLEMDRFEVIAKAPAGASLAAPPGSAQGTLPDAVREMLQSLLADRFKLAIRQEIRPLPGLALTVDKKPLMKLSDGSGDTGCKSTPPADPADPTIRLVCRNMSMEAVAGLLPRASGSSAGVLDKTELKGLWNFDVQLERSVSLQDAAGVIARQLGLKLEPQPVPTPVLVVASVNETPTANDPGAAEALPIAPQPTAFDVADFKPTDPSYPGYTTTMNPQGGGLWVSHGVTLSALLLRAFSPSYAERNEDLVVGMPSWAATTRFDLTARSPAGASASARAGPMVRSLLEERLKLKWHTEERPVSVYVLTAAKPKMKKADPASRTHCLNGSPPAGAPAFSVSLTCQNITMEQFGEAIRRSLPGPGSAVLAGAGLEGGWDFTLTYLYARSPAASSGGDTAALGGAPAASDPNGGLTLVEALEKQLGLKLETQKRPMTVTVIDHVERTPTDN
jgi:uncharacterized protein (TIGR03435 family)